MSQFRDRAACRDADPELFFPIGDGVPARKQTVAAKLVCHRCLVAADCLAWALRTGQAEGVWGGHTPTERRELHRRLLLAAPSPPAPGTAAGADTRSAVDRSPIV